MNVNRFTDLLAGVRLVPRAGLNIEKEVNLLMKETARSMKNWTDDDKAFMRTVLTHILNGTLEVHYFGEDNEIFFTVPGLPNPMTIDEIYRKAKSNDD